MCSPGSDTPDAPLPAARVSVSVGPSASASTAKCLAVWQRGPGTIHISITSAWGSSAAMNGWTMPGHSWLNAVRWLSCAPCPESRASQQDHSLVEAPISALTRRGSLLGGSYAVMTLLLCYDIVCMEEEE